MSLTTTAKVKNFLGITTTTNDTQIGVLVDIVDKTIKNYCERNIELTTITNFQLETDGVQDTFFLQERPITGISGITNSGNTISSDEYELNALDGVIRFAYAPDESIQDLKVTYSGGYATVPADVEGVATMMVADLFRISGGGNASGLGTGSGEIQSEKLGDYSVTYAVDKDANSIDGILNKYKTILNCYKVKHI